MPRVESTSSPPFQVPTIDRKMWEEVQKFDISRLILTEIEGNAASRDQWEHELLFFHPLEDALEEDLEEEVPSVTQMLKLYHDGGRTIGLPHRDVLGVLMPTQSLLDHMRKKYKLQDFTPANIIKLQERLAPLHVRGTIQPYRAFFCYVSGQRH